MLQLDHTFQVSQSKVLVKYIQHGGGPPVKALCDWIHTAEDSFCSKLHLERMSVLQLRE